MKGIGLKTLIKGFVEFFKNAKKSGKMMKASGMWMRAKKEADEKRKTDGHRYFVIYDAGQKKLISITYDIYESRGDSYQYLRQRGRFKRPLTRDELKALCFYYTTSKWTNKEISEKEEQEKLVEWQKYYLRINP